MLVSGCGHDSLGGGSCLFNWVQSGGRLEEGSPEEGVSAFSLWSEVFQRGGCRPSLKLALPLLFYRASSGPHMRKGHLLALRCRPRPWGGAGRGILRAGGLPGLCGGGQRRLQAAALPDLASLPFCPAEDGYVKMFLRGRPIPMFVPDAVVATYSLDAKLELPHKKLKLDWVYPAPGGSPGVEGGWAPNAGSRRFPLTRGHLLQIRVSGP